MTNLFNHTRTNLTQHTHREPRKTSLDQFAPCARLYPIGTSSVITTLLKFYFRQSSGVLRGVRASPAGRGDNKTKAEPGCQRNPKEIRPPTPLEPDRPPKLKDDAQIKAFFGFRVTRGAPTQSGTLGTQPNRNSVFKTDITDISSHLPGGISDKHQLFSTAVGSCPQKIQLKVPKETTLLDLLPCYNLGVLHTLC